MRTIKLMADYQCHPLWEATVGEVGNINPDSLPLSDSLKTNLLEWAQSYDATLNMDDPVHSGFPSNEAEAIFRKVGNELGERLRSELEPAFKVEIKV